MLDVITPVTEINIEAVAKPCCGPITWQTLAMQKADVFGVVLWEDAKTALSIP